MRLQLEERPSRCSRARGEARDRDRRDGDRRDRQEGRRDEQIAKNARRRRLPARTTRRRGALNDGLVALTSDARRPDPPRPDVRRPDPLATRDATAAAGCR